jgi:GNAT superfamily N-acetyltransferase
LTTYPQQVRPYRPDDREAVLRLADRLAIGVAPWRDAGAILTAVRGWVRGAIEATAGPGAVLVAEDARGVVVGFVSVEPGRHWSGQEQAYVGELIVAEAAEGRGVGRALMEAAEEWARGRGYGMLVLETGAANARARAFYARLGYAEEDVRLTKILRAE